MCSYGTDCSFAFACVRVCVLDEREGGAREPPGPGCCRLASHAGLSAENLGYEGETRTTAGQRQRAAQRQPGLTAEQRR